MDRSDVFSTRNYACLQFPLLFLCFVEWFVIRSSSAKWVCKVESKSNPQHCCFRLTLSIALELRYASDLNHIFTFTLFGRAWISLYFNKWLIHSRMAGFTGARINSKLNLMSDTNWITRNWFLCTQHEIRWLRVHRLTNGFAASAGTPQTPIRHILSQQSAREQITAAESRQIKLRNTVGTSSCTESSHP